KKKQNELERNFQVILIEIAKYIERGNLDWSGKELAQTEEILEEAIRLVELDKENHFYRDQHSYYNYFIMREGQLELLENMLSLATRIRKNDDVSKRLSVLYSNVSSSLDPGNTAIVCLNDLEELREKLKEKELSPTHAEFETRGRLIRLSN